jgi:ArsR family metal-binding transcriptional regulator
MPAQNSLFLESIALTRTLPCLAYPGRIIVTGRPSRQLDEVLPYLATLPGVIAYNPQAHTLTFRRQPGFLTLYSDRIYITQVGNVEEGLALLKALADAINATWEHRAELVAIKNAKRAPRPLDIWTLLPQTNCGQCGEQTCMAFACNLLLSKRELVECRLLYEDAAFSDRRATLEALS